MLAQSIDTPLEQQAVEIQHLCTKALWPTEHESRWTAKFLTSSTKKLIMVAYVRQRGESEILMKRSEEIKNK